MITILISIVTTVPVILLKIFLKVKLLKCLGIIIVMFTVGISYYIAIVNTALMGLNKSNEWTMSYMGAWIIDFSFLSPLASLIKI